MSHNTDRTASASVAPVPVVRIDDDAVRIDDDAVHHRFDLFVDDELVGILGYRFGDGAEPTADGAVRVQTVALMHTVVKEAYGDRGWAAVLVRGALNTARDRDWRIVPICSYVRRYLARHQEFMDLVVD